MKPLNKLSDIAGLVLASFEHVSENTVLLKFETGEQVSIECRSAGESLYINGYNWRDFSVFTSWLNGAIWQTVAFAKIGKDDSDETLRHTLEIGFSTTSAALDIYRYSEDNLMVNPLIGVRTKTEDLGFWKALEV